MVVQRKYGENEITKFSLQNYIKSYIFSLFKEIELIRIYI